MEPLALFVGDIGLDLTMVIDRVPEPDAKLHVATAVEATGGVAAIAAVACARAGGKARLMVQLGADDAGWSAAEGVRTAGVEMDSATADHGGTCRVVILIEPHGEKRQLLYPGGSMYPSLQQVARETFASVDWVHTVA